MANTNAVAPPARPQMNVQQANNAAQRLVVQNAVEMTQNIYSALVYPTSQPTINITPRNVGIIKKFVVRVIAGLQNNGTGAATITQNAAANLLSNVTFYDLQNNLRVNTNGIHLTALAGAKRRKPFCGAGDFTNSSPITLLGGQNITLQSQMFAAGSPNRPVVFYDNTIAAGATGTVEGWFEVPVAYSDDDLRGAVFANVVNTTMSLSLTLNASGAFDGPSSSGTRDDTYAIYDGATGLMTQAQVDVWQVYLDQLPTAQDGSFILPQISLATVYELKNTMFTAIAANQDFPVPFTNFRDFFSVFALYNANGTFNGKIPTNINYWSLTTANFTNVWKYTSDYSNMLARDVLGADMPTGMYYFSFRKHPIWTTQFGNQQINLNATNVLTSAAYLHIFWESMALQNTLVGSASLPAGG